MSVFIPVNECIWETAHQLAIDTYLQFATSQGHYQNTNDSHFRGKIGELACVRWAVDIGICCDATILDPTRMRDADLILGTPPTQLRVDVKTWNTRFWQDLGRCVAVTQMPSMRAKADAAIWCTTDSCIALGTQVEIVGWNTIPEIEAIQPVWTGASPQQVFNHQIPIESVRPLAELAKIITTPA